MPDFTATPIGPDEPPRPAITDAHVFAPAPTPVPAPVVIDRTRFAPASFAIRPATEAQIAAVAELLEMTVSADGVGLLKRMLDGSKPFDARKLLSAQQPGDVTQVKVVATARFGDGGFTIHREAVLSREERCDFETLTIGFDPKIKALGAEFELDPDLIYDGDELERVWVLFEGIAERCGVAFPAELIGVPDEDGDPTVTLPGECKLQCVPLNLPTRAGGGEPVALEDVDDGAFESRRAPNGARFDPSQEHLCPHTIEAFGVNPEELGRLLVAAGQLPLAEAIAGPLLLDLLAILDGEHFELSRLLELRMLKSTVVVIQENAVLIGTDGGTSPDESAETVRLTFAALATPAGPLRILICPASEQVEEGEHLYLEFEWEQRALDRPGAEVAVATMVSTLCDALAGSEKAAVRDALGPLLVNSPAGPAHDSISASASDVLIEVGLYRRGGQADS